MRILCLLKFVPDVDQLRYDCERNILVRENVRLMLNPEDVTALATALELKRDVPETTIEAVSMAPRGAMPHMEDLVRRGIDQATLISDPHYAGSDTWATSRVLAQYIGTRDFDCIFCGTRTLDAGTGQVPAQLAEALGLPLMVGISNLVELTPQEGQTVVDVDGETAMLRFSVPLPAVLGFQYNPERKLPYIRFKDLNRDISSLITVLGNDKLGMEEAELGLKGSLTQVRSLKADALDAKEPLLLQVDQDGIETVYQWLAQKGFLQR
jgi:electron transfer flavoprotein beta subunit